VTGQLLAIAIGRVLAEWRHAGYLPPCEPHPITGVACARVGCDGQHDHDGLPPWTEPEETR
jgi:hypothetical protein